MTDRCRFTSSTTPRVVVGAHDGGCVNPELCSGCLPCPAAHCRCCGVEHSVGACAGCVGEARENLAEIRRMCRELRTEAVHRGVNGEAMVLLGPATDPEAWGHHEASALAGRIPADFLDFADDDRHPLLVLGTWAMTYRDAFEHDEPDDRATVELEAAYIDRNLAYAATFEWVPFEDMSRDLRGCRSHLEAVLHDGEQIDRGAPCMTCSKLLTRVWGKDNRGDGWECRRCRTRSTEAQYEYAVTAYYVENSDWLSDVHMQARTGVKAGTVRVWAQRDLVAKRVDSGRVVYSVADVEARRDGVGLAS